MLMDMLVARKELGLKQKEIAARVGISPQKISTIERGTCVPTVFEALRIAKELGKPVEYLFKESNAQ